MARKLNNELLRDMAESVADVPDGRMLNNDYLRIIAENFSGGGGGGGTGTVDASSIVGVIPAENLPSYVDDVLEYSSQSALPATGETGKIYVTTDTNTTYRWSGSAYVPISNPLDYATQAEAEAGAENTHVMTPLRTKQAIDASIGDAYELPLMSPTTRGGAKLGHGLAIEDGALGIGEVTDPTDAGPIVALSAKGWAEQDTTTGKNLLVGSTQAVITIPYVTAVYYDINGNKASGAGANATYQSVTIGQTYTFNVTFTGVRGAQLVADNNGTAVLIATVTSGTPVTFTASYDTLMFRFGINENETATITEAQLELGSTATSYEPYTGGAPSPSPSYPQEIRRVTGHTIAGKTGRYVDILVTHDGTTTTIPIPLPSRGWVAALPDGTCDTLTLDGAGGYVWELNTQEVTFDGSSDEAWQLGASGNRCTIRNTSIAYPPSDYVKLNAFSTAFPAESNSSTYVGTLGFAGGYSYKELHFSDGTGAMVLADWKTYLASNPVTVLYQLATPTTESGYVDMPTVPIHATISSVDLVDLTVRCCADEGAAEISAAWGRRYESRIANLESAVATLVAAGA